MSAWAWVGVLGVSVWGAYWGAERLTAPLAALRRRWGLTEAAGAAFIAIATASPEVGVNVTSALHGVGDIGLGNMLGANIVPIPLIVTVAYLAARLRGGAIREEEMVLERSAVTVHALPYVAIVLLVALVTLPAPWRGLQPVDGWIMVGAYVAYLGQAVLRGRGEGEKTGASRRELALAGAGAAALAVSAYLVVRATESLVDTLGISGLLGGLLITATMSVLPEAFATWKTARRGQITTAATGMIADNAVTLTIAFLPLGLATVPIADLSLYLVNLGFVLLMPLAYVLLVQVRPRRMGFTLGQVLVLDALYLVFLAVLFFVVPG